MKMRPETFVPATRGGDTPHQELTSTTTSDVKSFTVPRDAAGVIISVTTTAAQVTFDGSTPSATNGIKIPAAVAPYFLPINPFAGLKFVSTAAANSVVDVLFVG